MKTVEEVLTCESPYFGMKQSTLETINNYVTKGLKPGGFVTAVLANDLMESIGRADSENRMTLFQIASYVYNEIPASSHGSYEIVENWIKNLREEKG